MTMRSTIVTAFCCAVLAAVTARLTCDCGKASSAESAGRPAPQADKGTALGVLEAGGFEAAAAIGADTEVRGPADLTSISGATDEFEDRRTIEEWAERDPNRLIDWVLALPDTLLKRRTLYLSVCRALANRSPEGLLELVRRNAQAFSGLNLPEKFDVLSRLDKSDLTRFQNEVEPLGIETAFFIPDVDVVREVRRNGFESALEMVARGSSTDLARSVRSLLEQLPDSSPETLGNIFAQLRETDWWEKDANAAFVAVGAIAKYNGELAVREGLRLSGVLGQTAVEIAFTEWFKVDPEAALGFLPRSEVSDRATQIGVLHAIKKYAKDSGLSDEADALLQQLEGERPQ